MESLRGHEYREFGEGSTPILKCQTTNMFNEWPTQCVFLCRLELNICWNLIKSKQYTCWERCLFEVVKQANLICDDLESSNWFPTNFLHWCFGELLSGYSSCWPFAFVCLRCFLICVFVTFYHSKSTGNHHYFSNHPTSKSKVVARFSWTF